MQSGELVALLGPSGSGKTTLLRIIAGLEIPEQGTVILSGEDATAKNPQDRRVGFVFQHYALFRHMTVYENVAFGLQVRPRKIRPAESVIREKVFSLLKLVQLDRFASRYPAQLSGGQRQRVALARALAVEPKVLLLDEPFGSLDANIRKELRRWLRRLHDEIHVTSVFVTHDQEEALEVADRVVIMNEGHIEQIGTPEEVYHNPATPFVYHFLGDVNIFHCRTDGEKTTLLDQKLSKTEDSSSQKPLDGRIFVRPHSIDLSFTPEDENSIYGKIVHINPAGPYVKVEIRSVNGNLVQASISQERYKELNLQKEMNVYLIPREMHTFFSDEKI